MQSIFATAKIQLFIQMTKKNHSRFFMTTNEQEKQHTTRPAVTKKMPVISKKLYLCNMF